MASLTHFSHRHKLVKTKCSNQLFTCDLCGTSGSGLHYRCNSCNFDLHDYCAQLSETIQFFAHPWHDLHLGPGPRDPHVCDLCREPVHGYYYRCNSCNFDVHPHCTATKQVVHTKLHPQHSLNLAPGFCTCDACHELNGIWLYRCGICNVNLHIKCLHGPIRPNVRPYYAQNNAQQVVHCPANNSNSNHGSMGNFMSQVGTQAAGGLLATAIGNFIFQS